MNVAEVKQEFVDSYLYGKMLEAVKPLHEMLSALDPCEERLTARIKGIISDITSTEI
jgi:hypothetical protein